MYDRLIEPLRLITIPISHYCEKARWGLDRAGIDYVEDRHLQLFHHWYAKRSGGGLTTPVLVLDDGTAIGDSTAILEWIDTQVGDDLALYPEAIASRVRAVEDWLDSTLGPDGRAWMYKQILPHKQLAGRYGLDGISKLERRAFDMMFSTLKPYLAARIRASGANTDLMSVRDVFDEVAARIDDGRDYIFGDRFTAADLTFAALSASVLLPQNYGVLLPPLEELPPDMRTAVEGLREHPAGQFALRLFANDRVLQPALSKRSSD